MLIKLHARAAAVPGKTPAGALRKAAGITILKRIVIIIQSASGMVSGVIAVKCGAEISRRTRPAHSITTHSDATGTTAGVTREAAGITGKRQIAMLHLMT